MWERVAFDVLAGLPEPVREWSGSGRSRFPERCPMSAVPSRAPLFTGQPRRAFAWVQEILS